MDIEHVAKVLKVAGHSNAVCAYLCLTPRKRLGLEQMEEVVDGVRLEPIAVAENNRLGVKVEAGRGWRSAAGVDGEGWFGAHAAKAPCLAATGREEEGACLLGPPGQAVR